MIKFTLPWPPSVNSYWRRNGGRYFISGQGTRFRMDTQHICLKYRGHFESKDRLSVIIDAFPPDRRRRDLDNIQKGLFDSLQHSGVYVDDNQIDQILITRQTQLLGKVEVTISKMELHRPESQIQNVDPV
jgi:crossover junction endodeoxyribonuclease RusA